MHLTQGLHRSIQLKGNSVATVFGARRQSWREVGDRVARLAAGLVSLGLRPGQRVAPIALNSDRYLELYYAVWWAGGVIVPGNTRWAVAEHIYALKDSGAQIVVVDKNFASMIPPIVEACGPKNIVFLDDGPAPHAMLGAEYLISSFEPIADACGKDDELAALFYTGGTTGRSKGVMLSHRSLITSFLCSTATAPSRDDQIYLHSPPMFHLADAAMVSGVTMMGGTHVIVPFFNPESVAKVIETEAITDLVLVPTMLGMLREFAIANPVSLLSVRKVTYGASPISETLLRQSMALFPNADFRQAYGQTELSPTATILTAEFHKLSADGHSYLRSAGRAIVGVDVKIVDEQMVERSLGEVGEVTVRSPGVMLGYWNQPELTQQTIVDGWIRTGDAGYMDQDGFVFLVDRVKDMIVSGGENIYSAEVENAIAAHPNIIECAVIGIPDDIWGEQVHAIVRLQADAVISAGEIIQHCHTLIAGYKCPRSVEFRAEPLPLSGAGKILKTELRKAFWGDSGRAIN